MTFEQKKELKEVILNLQNFIDDPGVSNSDAWEIIDAISKLESVSNISKEEYKEHFRKQQEIAA